jgi:DNA-directed RNA polymerase III subunit RPC2
MLLSTYRYTVLKETYDGGIMSDRIAKPQRDRDGALVRQNMRVKKD